MEYLRFHYSFYWVRFFFNDKLLLSLAEFITMYALAKKTKVNLRALRNLRVLRPLKSINAIPTMRKLVATLVNSMP